MKLKIMVLAIVAMVVCSNYALASEKHSHSEHPKTAVKVNNVICPVSGENVEDMGGGIEYEYKGKIYSLCCPSCVKVFEKDPEKYIAIIEESSKEEHKGNHHPH